MKRTYHLCLSGGNEVMFRNEADYVIGINYLCMAAHKTGNDLLAYSFMSNHVHICARTKNPAELIKHFRYSYTRYFNNKYKRKGRLGEKHFFSLEIEGLYHLLTVIAYILRNPLHHGVSATPFGYRFSSIGAIFRREFGRFEEPALLSEKSQYLYLPDRQVLPTKFKMGIDGMILPETSIDVQTVQHYFSTARTFMYYMNRLSGEVWEKEQLQDQTNLHPITLEHIEGGNRTQDLKVLLNNEHGRANYNATSDIQLCRKIDNILKELTPKGQTLYTTDIRELHHMAKQLQQELRIPNDQLTRCFGGLI